MLRLLRSTGLGWFLIHCPTLIIAFFLGFGEGDSSVQGYDVQGFLSDLGLGLLALGLVAIIFYRLAPQIYGPPLRAAAINPTFATLCAVASLVAGLRWLI